MGSLAGEFFEDGEGAEEHMHSVNAAPFAQENRKKTAQAAARVEGRTRVQKEQDRRAAKAHAEASERAAEEERKEIFSLKRTKAGHVATRKPKKFTHTDKWVQFGQTTLELLKPVRLSWGPSTVHARVMQIQASKAVKSKAQREQDRAGSQ